MPILNPTMEQFSNFVEYIDWIERHTTFRDSGAVLIQPPPEWRPSIDGYSFDVLDKKFQICDPLTQTYIRDEKTQGTAFQVFNYRKNPKKITVKVNRG